VSDPVADLRAACEKQLDPVTVATIKKQNLDRDHILAMLVPQATLAPVVALLKAAGGDRVTRKDAVAHAMKDTT
jgi:hypothetical protein